MDSKFWDDMIKWVELMPDEEWAKILADFDKRVNERKGEVQIIKQFEEIPEVKFSGDLS